MEIIGTALFNYLLSDLRIHELMINSFKFLLV